MLRTVTAAILLLLSDGPSPDKVSSQASNVLLLISLLLERCSYFNWRQDTSSDLQLFAILSVFLILFGGLLKATLIRQASMQRWSYRSERFLTSLLHLTA